MTVPEEYKAEIESHEELFKESAWKLGEIQWHMEKAFVELNSKCYIEKKDKFDTTILSETTPFGEEVDIDRIHWYVFKREREIEVLKKKTEKALTAAQKLKKSSSSLKTNQELDSYFELIKTIKAFTYDHSKEIDDLYQYVIWLHKKDEFAPIILFTYRVWGTTRRLDRLINIAANTSKSDQLVKKCIETVLGLRRNNVYTIGGVFSELYADIADSVSDEYQGPILVPKQRVIKRTIPEVLNELATYFEVIRQSLRNIIIDIDKYNDQTSLLYRESFWAKMIKKALGKKVETQLWDFKQTLTMWHAAGQTKEESKVTFCEDVASFANAKGGALVIGVTDNHPRRIIGIEDLENKLKYAKDVLCKNEPVALKFTHFQEVNLKDEQGQDKTCLVIAIAQTKNVVSVKSQRGTFSYPIRLETGITRVDYSKIENSKEGISHDNFAFISDLYSFLHDH